jgi:hypothetical protein
MFKKNYKVEWYKVCLAVKGYSQVEGVDYEDAFSPMSKMDSIGLSLVLTDGYDLKVEQMT